MKTSRRSFGIARTTQQVRAAKDFAESDRLRDAISALGWTVKDTKDGQQLEKR
jgi:cysteinyl-tRNA synthetase